MLSKPKAVCKGLFLLVASLCEFNLSGISSILFNDLISSTFQALAMISLFTLSDLLLV